MSARSASDTIAIFFSIFTFSNTLDIPYSFPPIAADADLSKRKPFFPTWKLFSHKRWVSLWGKEASDFREIHDDDNFAAI